MNYLASRLSKLTLMAYTPFVLCALSVLVMLVAALLSLWNMPSLGFAWSKDRATVLSVDPAGAAAPAGLRPADQLLSGDPRVLLSSYGAGDTVELPVLRAGERRLAQLTLAEPTLSERVLRVEPIVIAATYWLFGLVGWALTPFHNVARLFFIGAQLTAAILTVGSLSTVGYPGSVVLFEILLLLSPALNIHFYSVFPDMLPTWHRRALILVAYSSATAMIALLLLLPTWSSGQDLRRLYVLVGLVIALAMLFWRRRQLSDSAARKQRLLKAGVTTSVMPLLLLSLAPEALFGTPLVAYHMTFPFLILLPLAYSYAVQQGAIGRFDFWVNRSLVFFTVGTLLLSCSYLLFAFLEARFSGLTAVLFNATTAVGLILIFTLSRSSIQRWIDHWFYGGWYNYRTIVRDLSTSLGNVAERTELIDRLSVAIRTMRFEQGALLWPRDGQLVCEPLIAVGPPLPPVAAPVDIALVRYFAAHQQLQSGEMLRRALADSVPPLTDAETQLLQTEGVRYWLPLARHATLQGVLMLGVRYGNEMLDPEDLDILATLAAQATLAAENVVLRETLYQRLLEVERMRDDLGETQKRLAESREAERLHLAQELHDGPIQDLYGANFQLNAVAERLVEREQQLQIRVVQQTLLQTNKAVRAICGELRPPSLIPFGLEMAIRSHVSRLSETHPGVSLELDLMHDGTLLCQQVRLVLFRVYQESVNNVLKHAHASAIAVRLSFGCDDLVLEIQDNGRGFLVPDQWTRFARAGHLGLLGVDERVQSIGGRLTVLSAVGQGTTIRVVVASDRLQPQAVPEERVAHAHQSHSG